MKRALLEPLLAIVLCFAAEFCAAAELPLGTVLVSRNRIEAENTSPGRMNHLAIYVGNQTIIESQAGIVEKGQGRGVIRTDVRDFLARDYSEIVALEPVDPVVGQRAAATAETLVGLPFRQLSSLPGKDRPRAMQRGVNCDSVIRYSYRQASGERLRRLRIPDRALMFADSRGPRVFKEPKVIR
jgi:cell wall-associated NlpC family hydrolase